MSDKFNLLPEGIRSAILCSRIFAINKPSIGRIEKEHILGLSSLLEITALQLQEARVRHVAPAAPELECDDLTVWRITLPSGEQCHFGTASMARAWGRGEGKVERVDLKVRPRLEVVHTPYAAAPTVPAGWKLVPVKPTIEMVEAGYDESRGMPDRSDYARVIEQYDAMLAAAPEYSAQEGQSHE